MADGKSSSAFLSKLVLVVICLAVAGLGTWMIIDPTGFADPAATGIQAKAKFLKDALSFATEKVGVRSTGAILAAIGLAAMWLVMRPSPNH
jgi:hypothetical protein